jgi:amidase
MLTEVLELTIAELHKKFREGTMSCTQIVEAYLERIRIYDQPTGLNSMVVINPRAVEQAKVLDLEYIQTKKLRPLHGVPVIVKDNFDTSDLQTSAGSLTLYGSVPPDDAFQVRRLRYAGAVLLGKSNMAEWAFSPYITESSIAGTTRNPYDLERVPAGSSGGTAAAIAANLGLLGLGTDTGNSIRGPASHCNLVGVRSTMGLTSRDGIVPLYLRNDVGGPMCRTVEDAAVVLDVIAGYDEADPATALCKERMPRSYITHLKRDALDGARIGVFRYYIDQPTTDPEIKTTFERALIDLGRCGAELVDPMIVPHFEEFTADLWCNTFQRDLNCYLSTLRDPPYRTLREIVDSGLYCSYNAERLRNIVDAPDSCCGDVYTESKNIRLREAVYGAMDKAIVDVFVYPTWSNPPRLVGDMESPHGDNSQRIPPHTGMPSLSVPMGYTRNVLPAGLQMVGKLFSEPLLLGYAYAYEQETKHRLSPERFP